MGRCMHTWPSAKPTLCAPGVRACQCAPHLLPLSSPQWTPLRSAGNPKFILLQLAMHALMPPTLPAASTAGGVRGRRRGGAMACSASASATGTGVSTARHASRGAASAISVRGLEVQFAREQEEPQQAPQQNLVLKVRACVRACVRTPALCYAHPAMMHMRHASTRATIRAPVRRAWTWRCSAAACTCCWAPTAAARCVLSQHARTGHSRAVQHTARHSHPQTPLPLPTPPLSVHAAQGAGWPGLPQRRHLQERPAHWVCVPEPGPPGVQKKDVSVPLFEGRLLRTRARAARLSIACLPSSCAALHRPSVHVQPWSRPDPPPQVVMPTVAADVAFGLGRCV